MSAFHRPRRLPGGVQPPENKAQSLSAGIAAAGVPEQLLLPLSQHIGAPAQQVVAAGERVLKGQLLARASGLVSAQVHAPTSGVIVAIEARPLPHPSGAWGPCLVLQTDRSERAIAPQPPDDWRQLSRSECLARVRAAGVVGMGGAGFPAAVKLAGQPDKPVDTLIVNGTECEPYITADDALMRERPQQIIAGAELLGRITGAERILVGIEDNKPEAIASMRGACEGSAVQIVTFATRYPSGGEKQLIYILTGKEVPSGGLPADIGVVCQNVDTTAAVYRAVALQLPVLSRITTVTGSAVASPRNFETLIGTPVEYLLGLCGFSAARAARVVMGGPMMGFALDDLRAPIVKTSNCVLAMQEEDVASDEVKPCIRCGMCAQACPVGLLPQQLYWYAKGKNHEELQRHSLFDCIECGACAYVCPSKIPLVQYYRASKMSIAEKSRQQVRADLSKQRFEERQTRVERLKREREQLKLKRRAQAKATDAGDAVRAAVERVRAKKARAESADGDSGGSSR